MFTVSRLSTDEMVIQYFTKLIAVCKKLIGTTEVIADAMMNILIFTILCNSSETTIQILEQHIPASTTEQCMDAIREDTE